MTTYRQWIGCAVLLGASAMATFYVAQDKPLRVARARPMISPAATAKEMATPAGPGSGRLPAQGPTLYEVESNVRKARLAGATDNEIYRIRAAALPAQAIAMLAEREQAQAEWTQRVQAWQVERAKLPAGDRDGEQRLRDTLFSADEIPLLATLEQAGAPQLVQSGGPEREEGPGQR